MPNVLFYTQHTPSPSRGCDMGAASIHLSARASYTSTARLVSRPSKPPTANALPSICDWTL